MQATESFKKFLTYIRLPQKLRDAARDAHNTLQDQLWADARLKELLVDTFLQGSYKRHTGTRPEAGKKADVDVVVVTKMDRTAITPRQALDAFLPFLKAHYKGAYQPQGRSWGIVVGEVELDLVPTSKPSEATVMFLKEARSEGFQREFDGGFTRKAFSKFLTAAAKAGSANEPLWIPDREASIWDQTNPIEQIDWTIDKNDKTDGHYVNVVKAVKWWRSVAMPGKRPKGYPLEHLVGANCPDGIASIAEGFTRTAESIVSTYAAIRRRGSKPILWDHGVPAHDVFAKISNDEFAAFYDRLVPVALAARAALDDPTLSSSIAKWRAIFGDAFPESDGGEGGKGSGNYTPRTGPSTMYPGRFA
jgi:hypothetical protein